MRSDTTAYIRIAGKERLDVSAAASLRQKCLAPSPHAKRNPRDLSHIIAKYLVTCGTNFDGQAQWQLPLLFCQPARGADLSAQKSPGFGGGEMSGAR